METPTEPVPLSEQDTLSATVPAGSSGDELDALTARLAQEMAAAWQQGARVRVEDFLQRDGRLRASPDAVIRLINEEICLRAEAGEEVSSSEIRGRFPQWSDELDILLHCHHLIAPEQSSPAWPEVGERFGGFRLLSELGRGGVGRVFLASQPLLSGRLVVLKLTPLDGREHLLLSSLQHTHIVPLYAVQEDRVRRVQAYCMPYLGGTTLTRLLEYRREPATAIGQAFEPAAMARNAVGGSRPAGTPDRRRVPAGWRGADLLQALDQCQDPRAAGAADDSPARRYLAGVDGAQAVCWIGACLADALHYVHQRGLVHLDVKPSNILIAADGQPMLLDFHLASAPLRAGEPVPPSFGGTPGYLAPEHAAAMAAAAKRQPVPSDVDGRTDLYSLGVVLYEALAGRRPPSSGQAPERLDRLNPQVSRGLADIVRKCLARDPAARHADAAALADDLRRHLTHRPLRGAGNRSLAERWRKWRRRRPASLPLAAMLLLAVIAAGSAGVVAWTAVTERSAQAEDALRSAREQQDRGQHALATRTLRRGRAALAAVPFSSGLQRQFAEELRRTAALETVATLRQLLDQLRFLPTTDGLAPGQSAELQTACAAVWKARQRLAAATTGQPNAAALRNDLRDFGILWADLRSKREMGTAGHRAALQILAEAEALSGPSPILEQERRRHAEAVGDDELARQAARRAAAFAPDTAWEHFSLGLSQWHAGRTADARESFRRAADRDPTLLWPHVYEAACAQRLGRPEDAVHALDIAVALDPDRAELYLHRGQAYAALGQTDRAAKDYARALERDPALTAAAIERARLHRQQGNLAASLSDLEAALSHGGETDELRHLLALAHWERRDKTAALESLRRALELNPDHQPARQLYRHIQRTR